MYEELIEPPLYVTVNENGVGHAVRMKFAGDMIGGEWHEGFRVMSEKTLCGRDTAKLQQQTLPGKVWESQNYECDVCRERHDAMVVV